MKRFLIAGHSHIGALRRAWSEIQGGYQGISIDFLALRERNFLKSSTRDRMNQSTPESIDIDALSGEMSRLSRDAHLTILSIRGNQHTVHAFSARKGRQSNDIRGLVCEQTCDWLRILVPHIDGQAAMMLPPPPIESEEHIRSHPGLFRDVIERIELPPPQTRLQLWTEQIAGMRAAAEQFGLPVLELPEDIFSPSGFLSQDCWGNDPTHGNAEYGRRLLRSIILDDAMAAPRSVQSENSQSSIHPYKDLPDIAFWKRAVADLDAGAVDPVANVCFRIRRDDKVATAGSCFAQHISKRLRASGFNFFSGGIGEARRSECTSARFL